MIYWLCFVLISFIISEVISFGMLGPANMEYQKSEKCPDEPPGILIDLSGRRINRTTFAFTVEIDSPYDFDDNLGVELQGSQLLDGGYKKGSFQMIDNNACKTMHLLMGDVFLDFIKQANVTDCPVPKGRYLIENFIFDNEKFTVPKVFGDYRMEVKTTHNGVPQSCIYAYYKLTPKDKF